MENTTTQQNTKKGGFTQQRTIYTVGKPDVKKLNKQEANIFYKSLLEMIINWKQEEQNQ